jgi:hypothetical protein
MLVQEGGGKIMNRTAVNLGRECPAIASEFLRCGLPMPERDRIPSAKLEAAANDQHQSLAGGIEYLDGERRVRDGACEDHVFPRKMVVLEQPVAGYQSEVQVNVNQSTGQFVVSEKAQKRGMIAARHGREELQPALHENDLAAVLIVPGYQKV